MSPTCCLFNKELKLLISMSLRPRPLLLKTKKVFQGGIGQTTLGENTAGGAQAYTRRLNNIKMVNCSNHFQRDVLLLTEEDQDYSWQHIFYFKLEPGETVFEDTPAVDTGHFKPPAFLFVVKVSQVF